MIFKKKIFTIDTIHTFRLTCELWCYKSFRVFANNFLFYEICLFLISNLFLVISDSSVSFDLCCTRSPTTPQNYSHSRYIHIFIYLLYIHPFIIYIHTFIIYSPIHYIFTHSLFIHTFIIYSPIHYILTHSL